MTTTLKKPAAAAAIEWDRRRVLLYELVRDAALNVAGWEALEAHFANMPDRYWGRVDETALRWHLQILRAFYAGLNRDGQRAVLPVVRWRHRPKAGYTEVVVCTWDRVALLAKVAGALAEVGLSILRAEVYTRRDDVVLDVFYIGNRDAGGIVPVLKLRQMVRALARLCEPPTDAGVSLKTTAKSGRAAPQINERGELLPVVEWNHVLSDSSTVLELEAADRVGLLYGILRILADHNINVLQAVVTTENGVAGDVFFVQDQQGRKIPHTERLETVRNELLSALA